MVVVLRDYVFMDDATNVADRIRELMNARGFSQAEFALRLGITQQQVSNLLSGKRAWTQRTWEAAAEALDVTPVELFGQTSRKGSDNIPVILIFEKNDYRRLRTAAKAHMIDVPSFIKFTVGEYLRRESDQGHS